MSNEKIDAIDRKIKESADKAFETFDSVRQEAKAFAEDLAEAGEEGLKRAKSTAKKVWDQAKETGSEWGERVADTGEEGWAVVKSFAKKKPIQTAAIAFALGVLVGSLILGSKSED